MYAGTSRIMTAYTKSLYTKKKFDPEVSKQGPWFPFPVVIFFFKIRNWRTPCTTHEVQRAAYCKSR
jgi:hypothetical protein